MCWVKWMGGLGEVSCVDVVKWVGFGGLCEVG